LTTFPPRGRKEGKRGKGGSANRRAQVYHSGYLTSPHVLRERGDRREQKKTCDMVPTAAGTTAQIFNLFIVMGGKGRKRGKDD